MQHGCYKLKYSYFLTGFLLFFHILSFAQTKGLINDGAKIVLTTGSNIYIDGTDGHYTNQNGGEITNNSTGGTIKLFGNWTNNALNTVFSSGTTTTVEFLGAAQSISGTNATGFYNFLASGSGTKTFSSDVASTVSNLVTLSDNITVNANSKLTLLASATSNANVAAIPGTSSITGNVNVQVYFTGNGDSNYRGTRAISSPVTEAVSSTYSQLKNYMVITGKLNGGFDLGGSLQPYGVSLTNYNEAATLSQSQFTQVESISSPLLPGHGSFLFFRGSRDGYDNSTPSTSSKVNAPFAAPENVIMQYTGPINQQNVEVSVPYTSNNEVNYDGYKLIGNPYPAVINWGLVTKVGMEDELKIVKPMGGFATYKNGVVANITELTGDSIRFIKPGQAFYVRSKSGGGTVTFTEASKSFTASPLLFMSSPKDNALLTTPFSEKGFGGTSNFSGNEFRITLQNTTHKEEAVTVFRAGSSAASQREDAVLFGGSTVILSTLSSDNVKLTINFMPEISDVQELRLSVNAAVTGAVKLNFTDLSAARNYDVFLKDNFQNTITNVRSAPVYDFVINKTIPASYGDSRFVVLFKPLSTAADFIAKKANTGAELSWTTLTGPNNGKFEIERSEDGLNYAPVGSVDYLVSSTSYSFLDKKPLMGNNYYRLKQTDKFGNVIYSQPAFLDYKLDDSIAFLLYPNPSSESISIDLNSRNASIVFTLRDLQGKELMRETFLKDQRILQNISHLHTGVYIVQLNVEGSNELIGSAKLIKE